MKYTPNNFLELCKQIVVGGGFAVNSGSTMLAYDGGFYHDVNNTIGDLIPSASTAAITTEETNAVVWKIANGTTPTLTLAFRVPRDYDENTDYINIRVIANKVAAGADVPTLGCGLYIKQLGAALGSSTAPNATYVGISIPKVTLIATTQVQEFNFANKGLIRDSMAYFVLTVAGNTTGGQEVQIFDMQVVYASCLVAFGDPAALTGNSPSDLSANDALGFPLRG